MKKSLRCQTVQFVDKVASPPLATPLHQSVPPSLSVLLLLLFLVVFFKFFLFFVVSLRPNEKFGATCCRKRRSMLLGRRIKRQPTRPAHTHVHTHTHSSTETENIMKKACWKVDFNISFTFCPVMRHLPCAKQVAEGGGGRLGDWSFLEWYVEGLIAGGS